MKKYTLFICMIFMNIPVNLCTAQEFVYPDFEAHPPFRQMKCGLWMNKVGNIAYKAIGCGIDSFLIDVIGTDSIWDTFLTKDEGHPVDFYMDWTYTRDYAPGINDNDYMKALEHVVDTASFKILSSHYFMDNNHIYTFRGSCVMSIALDMSIEHSIDRKSFKVNKKNPRYACDKNKCFYAGWEIEGADPKTFRLVSGEHLIARDKNHVYDAVSPMSESQITETEERLRIKLRK